MRQYHGKYMMLVCVLVTAAAFMDGGSFAETNNFLSPISVVAGVDGKEIFIAETTANQVAVFDIATGKVTKVIYVGEKPVGLDISVDGSKLYVTSAVPDGKVQIVDVRDGSVTDSIITGHTPVVVVAGRDGKMLYVCNQYNNNIGMVDLNSKKQIAVIDVVREPVAAALTSDGKYLFVANHLPAVPANSGYCASVISVIDTAARRLIKNIELPDGSTNVRGITISPDGRNAYITHVLARYQFPVTYLEKRWINTNAMTIIDVQERKFVNTVLVDDVGSGAANPYGVACTVDGKNILITHAGSYELSVIDRKGLHERLLPAETARNFTSEIHSGGGKKLFDSSYSAGDIPNDLTFLAGIRRRLKLKGIGSRGLAVIGNKVYIAEIFTDSLGVVDIEADAQSAVEKIPLGKVKPATFIRKGEVLFNDASLSYQKWNSCTSCHTGDGRAS
ncbi:MAG: hypothetical protein RQ760_17130, partial [Sedimentisphaerales bacterium]|nr:hypothetical protein [Sedimentisphaerales bacterium]